MAGCRVFNNSGFYAENSDGTDYQGLGNFSIVAWVYRNSTGANSIPFYIGSGAGKRLELIWYSADNILYMVNDTKYANSSANTSTGWIHIAGTFDGSAADASKLKVYINGVNATSFITSSNPTTTNASFSGLYAKVGKNDLYGLYEGNGNCLSHVSVYSTTLTAKEINELMFKPASPQRGRLHYWALNGNDTSATNNEADMQRVHYLTGNNMASTSASMLSPRVCIGGSAQCL